MTQVVVRPREPKKYQRLVEAGIHPFVAHLLVGRGIEDPEQAKHYLNDGAEALHDASLIPGMSEIAKRLEVALEKGEKVAIFGDYDVDGVTSTAILYLALKEMRFDVMYRLPDRLREGYGMSEVATRELADRGAQLVITVDNGIRAQKEIALAKSLGMDVIVLDHHAPDSNPPEADVLVDLHLNQGAYPFKELAGCGLALKTVCYLYDHFGMEGEGLKFLDLAAIGTVADVVPLVGENRVIVKAGLAMINSREYARAGVVELLRAFEHEGPVNSTDIAFKIAPALNAPGRLNEGGAEEALVTLLAPTREAAAPLADGLRSVNEERKEISKRSQAEGEQYIADHHLENDKVLVLFLPDVPEGVVGLVSGKLTEKYQRPSIVFGKAHDAFKASARSTPKFNLFKALQTCDDLFLRYGGHAQAAGMSIKQDLAILEELRRRLNEYADTVLTEEDLQVVIDVDDVLEEKDLEGALDKIQVLEPFGNENPKPVFLVRGYNTRLKQKDGEWLHYAFIGVDKDHVRIYGEKNSEAIGFGMAHRFDEIGLPRQMNLVATLGLHIFRGRETLQLELMDISAMAEVPKEKTELMGAMAKAMEALGNF